MDVFAWMSAFHPRVTVWYILGQDLVITSLMLASLCLFLFVFQRISAKPFNIVWLCAPTSFPELNHFDKSERERLHLEACRLTSRTWKPSVIFFIFFLTLSLATTLGKEVAALFGFMTTPEAYWVRIPLGILVFGPICYLLAKLSLYFVRPYLYQVLERDAAVAAK